jgi:hypothetical protein
MVMAVLLLGAAARNEPPCRLIIDWNASPAETERTIWLAYLMYRVAHATPIKDCTREPTVVIPTFDEEFEARDATLKTYLRFRQRDAKYDLPYFNDLSRVSDAGFLREYVWVYLRQKSWSAEPSGLRLSEFETWQAENLKDHVPQSQGAIKVAAS